jgi:hypothetical protein
VQATFSIIFNLTHSAWFIFCTLAQIFFRITFGFVPPTRDYQHLVMPMLAPIGFAACLEHDNDL